MFALAVGNGESRSGIDLTQFKEKSIIVGCNALHRDLEIEHVVCCDRRMIDECLASDNTRNSYIYVREDWFEHYRKIDRRIRPVPWLPYEGPTKADDPKHWGSGPYAVLIAADLEEKPSTIVLLGFDLYPMNDSFNNIYKNTKNYNKETARPIDYSFWEYQTAKVFEHYRDRQFIILNRPDWTMPRRWQRTNVSFRVLDTKNLTSSVKESIISK
jgi:hypothetical protein